MSGRKVEPELRRQIIEESKKEGCIITNLAKQYGISKDTIYGWRTKYNNSAATLSRTKDRGCSTELDRGFVELTINEASQTANLQEATLKFNKFSLIIQGQIKSSTLISIMKILEEAC